MYIIAVNSNNFGDCRVAAFGVEPVVASVISRIYLPELVCLDFRSEYLVIETRRCNDIGKKRPVLVYK